MADPARKRGVDSGGSRQRPQKQARLDFIWGQPRSPKGQTLLSHFFGGGQLGASLAVGGKRPPAHLVGAVKRPKV